MFPVIALHSILISSAFALNSINWSIVDHITLNGDFTSASLKTNSQPTTSSYNLIISLPDSSFIRVPINGQVHSSCSFDKDYIFLGGSFTSINNTMHNSIVKFNTNTMKFQSLNNGLVGSVSSLFCDLETNLVIVGGRFLAPDSSSSFNLIQWDGVSWKSIGFKGVDGKVNAISSDVGGSLLVGGSFTSTHDSLLLDPFAQLASFSSAVSFIHVGSFYSH